MAAYPDGRRQTADGRMNLAALPVPLCVWLTAVCRLPSAVSYVERPSQQLLRRLKDARIRFVHAPRFHQVDHLVGDAHVRVPDVTRRVGVGMAGVVNERSFARILL